MKSTSDHRLELALYALLTLLLALTFTADILLPLGTAVWVIYLLPTAISYFLPRPQVPPALAALITLLIIIGYNFAPDGVDPDVARINRAFAVLTVWIIALTGTLFIRSRLAVQRQEWLQAGQVQLSLRMSGEQQPDQLAQSILGFLAGYLGINAAALFMAEGAHFVRQATYGAPADANIPQTIIPGDGLLGQAIKDERSFLLKDVPDGYLYYGSGLGRAKPRHLLITPAKSDGETNAVLELGFPHEPQAHDRELLERIAPSIAIAVRSARYRQRLQELVEETRRQSHELQQQGEELRASNEELEEQSRVLQESQARLETQQTELEQTNAMLEEQTQQLEAQRDDLSRSQTALHAQTRELEQASRYKSEFVANMSHELRTPLNALLIMSRLLADNRGGNLTEEQVKFALTIESSGNDLLALINDILDISRIEAGRLELQVAPVRIGTLVEKLQSAFHGAATEKGLELHCEVASGTAAEIETDSQRLEQVLKNFLANAIKFTEHGEVFLHVSCPQPQQIAFAVHDSGIGIAPDQQQAIFEPFQQADGSISRRYGGTGLGLSISRDLAGLLGGSIHLTSEPGKGSTFTLTIPHSWSPPEIGRTAAAHTGFNSPAATTPAASDADAPAIPRRSPVEDDRETLAGDSRLILVVEDDPAFARILLDLAHEIGFQCLVAQTADEGVMLARQYVPHAIILDINLPDHTGLSVLERVKRDTRTRHVPVHVVSVADYTQTALAFGAVSYMLKPVKREELTEALRALETRFNQRLRRILIVEDNPDQLDGLQSLLALREVEAIGARNAAECLSALGAETFDCMILDLSLPDASGFDVLEQLRQDDSLSFPPVIVYTGRELTAAEELQLRRFSKSIIIKGAKSPERLLDEVTLFLHQVVSELPERQRQMIVRSLGRDAMLEGRHILVAEDDIRNVFALTSIFEPHGTHIHIARNGREALRMLERAGTDNFPAIDLVLMDIMMPEMDGLTATREIRSRPEWTKLPIIALTAKARASDHEQCLAAGANDYLAKPLDVDKLLSLVRVWMPR